MSYAGSENELLPTRTVACGFRSPNTSLLLFTATPIGWMSWIQQFSTVTFEPSPPMLTPVDPSP
jgi:hypothetical protein